MTSKELKKEMLIAIKYLRGKPMKQWLKENWWKLIIIIILIQNFINQFGIFKRIDSYMVYAEQIFGEFLK